ncbi:hypothetical protein A2U01_0096509, partial [Trifolium medium]|nr:hypothetical protein [Trifolium medium]
RAGEKTAGSSSPKEASARSGEILAIGRLARLGELLAQAQELRLAKTTQNRAYVEV